MKTWTKSFTLNLIGVWGLVILVLVIFSIMTTLLPTFGIVEKSGRILPNFLSAILAILTGLLLRMAILWPFLAELKNNSHEAYYSATKEMKANSWKGYIAIVFGMSFYWLYFLAKFLTRLDIQKIDIGSSHAFASLGFILVTIGALIQLRYLVRGILKRKNVIEQS